MRLTKHTSGTVFHRLYSKASRRAYTWALSLKAGDVINSFDGWNHIVERIEIYWRHVGYISGMCRETRRWPWRKLRVPSGTYIHDICIHSTNGWAHYISETGCIVPAWSIKELILFHGEDLFQKMKAMGIISDKGIRLRCATAEENMELFGIPS